MAEPTGNEIIDAILDPNARIKEKGVELERRSVNELIAADQYARANGLGPYAGMAPATMTGPLSFGRRLSRTGC